MKLEDKESLNYKIRQLVKKIIRKGEIWNRPIRKNWTDK